jgi:hypothetical protein
LRKLCKDHELSPGRGAGFRRGCPVNVEGSA